MVDKKKIFDFSCICLISAFAFILSFKAGERGFFPLDQSIVFDGAYRIVQGQIPYKDFLMPFGPMVFWMQAVFFKIFGVNYFSYLLFSAIVNVIATLCSIYILKIIFAQKKVITYIAGILTAIWFYPPFGTPWLEQTSFFFSFLGLLCVLQMTVKPGNHNVNILSILTGVFSALSILSKQNAGLFFLPLYLILIYAGRFNVDKGDSKKKFLLFSTGFLTILFIFFVWLILYSDIEMFIQYFFKIPADMGLTRLLHNPSPMFIDLLTGRGPRSIRLVIFIFLIVAFYFFISQLLYRRTQKNINKTLLFASILYIYLTFYQNLFNHMTCNQDVNGYAFIGIMFAIGTGLSRELFNLGFLKVINTKIVKVAFYGLLLFTLSYVGFRGIEISLYRKVQDIFSNSKFPSHCAEEKLKNLRWGKPTTIENTDIEEQSIIDLIIFLKEQNENFFIFPDFTIFYGLVGVPSPQPLLWFQKEWTYSHNYDPGLDEWVVKELIKNNVKIIVIEEKSFLGTANRLDDFPLLKKYFEDNFQQVNKIGIFNIFLKEPHPERD